MGSAPVRRDPDTLLDSSLRRGSYVGPGMHGVYRLRRRPSGPPLAPQTVGDWITPDPYDTGIDWTTMARIFRRAPVSDNFSDEDAFSEYDVAFAAAMASTTDPISGEVYSTSAVRQAGDEDIALAISLSQLMIGFDLTFVPDWHPTEPALPPGATSIEYEGDTAVVGDPVMTGQWRLQFVDTSTGETPPPHVVPVHSGAILVPTPDAAYTVSGVGALTYSEASFLTADQLSGELDSIADTPFDQSVPPFVGPPPTAVTDWVDFTVTLSLADALWAVATMTVDQQRELQAVYKGQAAHVQVESVPTPHVSFTVQESRYRFHY